MNILQENEIRRQLQSFRATIKETEAMLSRAKENVAKLDAQLDQIIAPTQVLGASESPAPSHPQS